MIMAQQRKKQSYRTVSATHITDTIQAMNLNASELANKLGVTAGTVSNWRTKSEAPYWTTLACRGLMAKLEEAPVLRPEGILVIKCDKSHFPAFETIAQAVDAKVLKLS